MSKVTYTTSGMCSATIVQRLNKYRPASVEEMLDRCKFTLQHLDSGLFRSVYWIVGTDLVVKIPIGLSFGKPDAKRLFKSRDHARDEYKVWKRIKDSKVKYKGFKKYLPAILYFDSATGISVMRKYHPVSYTKHSRELSAHLNDLLEKALGTSCADIHYKNLGIDKNGNPKIMDLGAGIKG